mmetsp:Transcript_16932/g.51367  ORF Transcript_16932/g.51367 Transcript_16932/m.51367 type:complete len:203 (+) Transcript_16932:813-1421(+)
MATGASPSLAFSARNSSRMSVMRSRKDCRMAVGRGLRAVSATSTMLAPLSCAASRSAARDLAPKPRGGTLTMRSRARSSRGAWMKRRKAMASSTSRRSKKARPCARVNGTRRSRSSRSKKPDCAFVRYRIPTLRGSVVLSTTRFTMSATTDASASWSSTATIVTPLLFPEPRTASRSTSSRTRVDVPRTTAADASRIGCSDR